MEPVNVKFGADSKPMPIVSLEQIDVLQQQGRITADEAKNAKALFNAKNPPKTDEVTVSHAEATPEDEERAAGSRRAQADATAVAANTKYYSEESVKLPGKEARGFMYRMTEAANKGDYKTAAEHYLKLEQSGVFAEETGVQRPPFVEQMKDEIAALKQEVQAQFQREATAENVVRGVNSREGMEALVESYEGMDTKEEVKEEIGVTGRGAGKVAKNARKNKEHIQRQLNLNTVYVEGKTYTINGQEMTAEEAKKYQKEQLGDAWDKKRPQVQVMSKEGYAVAEKLNEEAKKQGVSILNPDGSIDIEKAQSVARGIVSIAGDRGDRNELELVAKELGVKEKDVKAFLRGLNIDYKKDKTWLAHTIGGVLGAGAATAALTTDFMTGGVITKAVSYIVPGAVNAAVNTTVDNTIHVDHREGPNKEDLWDQYETSFTTATTTYTTTPDTVGTKDVKVKPKKGFGDYLGAAALGYSVYDLSTRALKAVFNKDPNILKKDASLADALEDPTKLKKKHNQEVMQYIKDFKIEGYDEATQKQIKLALMEEAMGNNGTGKLNDRELVGIAAALRSIPPKEETSTPPTTTTTTPPTTTVTTQPTTTVTTPTREYGIDDKAIDNPTYKVKLGDNPAGMLGTFYGVPYNRKPGSLFQKLYTAWAKENNYHKGDNLVVGSMLSFPPIEIDGQTYEAKTDKDPTKGKVVRNNRARSNARGNATRPGAQGYERTNDQETWRGQVRNSREQAQADIDRRKQEVEEE